MTTALEQLRYLDNQLATFALSVEQAELVRVHRLMGLQLRSARLQELPSAPPADTNDYEQWERCRKNIEAEVELNLAETRLNVEGLEESWERWLHLEKLKTIREQLLQQTSEEGLLDPQMLHSGQHKGSFTNEGGNWPSAHGEEQAWATEHQHGYQDQAAYPEIQSQASQDYQQQAQEYLQRQEDPAQPSADVQPSHPAQQIHSPDDTQTGAEQVQQADAFPEGQLHMQQEWQQAGQEKEAEGMTGTMPQSVHMKLCRRCNTHKPVTEFYKSKANADGYDGRCKTCDAVQCAQRRKRKERVENPTVEWKSCRRCGMKKPANEFYRNKTNGDGLYNNCKICFSHDAASRRERLPPLEERTAAAKRCRRCKQTKPASEFYKNKHMSDGLYTHCKKCYTEAANQRSAGRAPAETKRCRRCGQTKEASDFYISKMTADGLQSYCKACYAVASAARRTRNHNEQIQLTRGKELDDYACHAAQQHLQDHLIQSQLDAMHQQQVMGVPHLSMSASHLQQLGYDPSLLQGGLEDPEDLAHQGLDAQLDPTGHQFDHSAHHMLDPQTQHLLESGQYDPTALDHQVLDHHGLGHHSEHEVYAHLDHDGSLLHPHSHLHLHPAHATYQEELHG